MELLLPLLGDVMTEGTLTRWLQPEGAQVRAGEPLYEVETDKVTLTVDAPASGALERVVAEGETVPVGSLIGRLTPVSVPVTPDGPRVTLAMPTVTRGDCGQVRATPAARAAARRLGVDLSTIANGRRIHIADVEAAARNASVTSGGALAGRRKVIAERMLGSLAQSAQLTVSMEVDVTEALRLRDQLTQLLGDDRRPSITDVVVRATVLALREHPTLNAWLRDGQLTLHDHVHMGLAVDADEGLIVPIIRDADQLDLLALAAATRDLSRRARDNRLSAEEVQGGTFSVTSLGQLGVEFFTPILNPPQVAILGIGRVFTKLELQSGRVEERQSMYLNLSFDHQVVDGAPAARFLQSVKRLLELPAALVVDTRQ